MIRVLSYILWSPILILFALYLVHVGDDIIAFFLNNLDLYKWFIAGFVIMSMVEILYKKSFSLLKGLTHEFAHTLVSWMFFRHVDSFHTNDDESGTVYHRNGWIGDIFISLAPYCFPYITYLIMALSLLGSEENLEVFKFMVGVSFGFHVTTGLDQTFRYQTDIHKRPLLITENKCCRKTGKLF